MEIKELIQEFVDEMKKPQELILDFLENDDSGEEPFILFVQYIKDNDIQQDKHKLYEIIRLISQISKNYQRSSNFFPRIEQILDIFKNDITKFFTNFEIFQLFKKDKRILLYLFNNKILIPDQRIFQIIKKKKYKRKFYYDYLYPEFKPLFDKQLCQTIEDNNPEIKNNIQIFYDNRKIGENHNYICKLIQKDLIDDFIAFINQSNIPFNSQIKPSIYETNSFLLKQKNISLIEYAAFFGAIQIFRFLKMNNVKLTSSLWFYSIHGKNAELIHLLEEDRVKPDDKTFEIYLFESIKCHHNDIMNYLINEFNLQNHRINVQGIKYSNFVCISNNEYMDMIVSAFFNLCGYDHYNIVNSILKNTNFNINVKNILL